MSQKFDINFVLFLFVRSLQLQLELKNYDGFTCSLFISTVAETDRKESWGGESKIWMKGKSFNFLQIFCFSVFWLNNMSQTEKNDFLGGQGKILVYLCFDLK